MMMLLVEDNPAEARLTREALIQSGLPHEIQVVTDGQMACDYLHRINGYSNAQKPTMVLLDLNLPRKHGREVLREIKTDPTLSDIPVIVVSNSSAPEDIEESYRLCANSYITKPADLDDLFKAIKSLVEFWFHNAQIPEPGK
jgi:two-component system, chemotaxis family, response regulator Rcp1